MNISQLESRLSLEPASPLFARLAHEYLTTGRLADAKQLCLTGLERYPTYLSAQIVLAKCFAADKQFPPAIEILDRAISVQPTSSLLKQLRSEWIKSIHPDQEPITEESNLSIPVERWNTEEIVVHDRDSDVISDPLETIEPVIEESLSRTDRPEHHVTDVGEAETTPRVDALSDDTTSEAMVDGQVRFEKALPDPMLGTQEEPEIMATQVPVDPIALPHTDVPAIESTWNEEGRIVSKTLAEIFASQGEFAEAIITYQLLKMRRPSEATEIDKRIKELHTKLQAKLTPQQ